MTRVDARLGVAESEYANARILEQRRRMLTASAGVSFSACPTQKDLTRRGAIGDEEAVLRGVVRHVTQTLGGYKVGVELHFDREG